ncbi:MAG: (d)CMP kinase [Clostridia bacterium]|nr:(d)CMP kinase [Clostridia bacterium]
MAYSIAIDGPGGAGKSTIAKIIAKKLGCVYIDTGAMYRAVGLFAVRKGINTENADELEKVLGEIEIDIENRGGEMRIFLCGEDVSDKIRTPEISMAASNVARAVPVRLKLVELQRKLAEKSNVIMDGRDIGSYVLPDADAKIYLTADVEDRAKRRYDELILKDDTIKLEDVLEDMKKRDYNDSHREFAPLCKAEDALLVDTTGLELNQSVEKLFNIIMSIIG